METRWCYGCDETKPLDSEHWAWANKEHTRFRTKCRKCTNWDSKISHRIARTRKKDLDEFTAKKSMEHFENFIKNIESEVN